METPGEVTLGERIHGNRKVQTSADGTGASVAKRYTDADASIIFADMQDLWNSPFGAVRTPRSMPEPLAVTESVVTMSYVDGQPLGTRGSLGTTLDRLPEVASLLGDLHNCGVRVPRRRNPDRLLRSLGRKAERIAHGLRGPFSEAIGELEAVRPSDEELVVNHGDFSPRNLLVSGSGLVLIDFDRLQMSGRGRDLGYFGTWIWVTEFMLDLTRVPTWDAADELLGLYARSNGANETSLHRSATFYRGAALLRIAESWSVLANRPDLSAYFIATATSAARRNSRSDGPATTSIGTRGSS